MLHSEHFTFYIFHNLYISYLVGFLSNLIIQPAQILAGIWQKQVQAALGFNFFNQNYNGILAQAALRAPPEVALQCVAGHCYYQLLVSLSFARFFFFLRPAFGHGRLFIGWNFGSFPKVGQKQKTEK